MKIQSFISRWLLVSLLTIAFAKVVVGSPREHLLLDANWKFHLGDNWPYALRLDKADDSSGPAAENFNDQSWRTLNLPHDWAIELPFDSNASMSHGFKPVGPDYLKTSVGWYRRTFELPKHDTGKRIWLQFDGVFRDTTIWVNGWLVKRHEGGYYPFREDITDVVHFGGTNVIAVRVDAAKFEGWFYEGAGIYRHVWLDKTMPVAIAPDGIFVYSKFKKNVPSDKAEIHVEVTLLNTLTNKVNAKLHCEILSPDGKSIATFKESKKVKCASQETVKLEGKVSSPVLWSPESPKLYKLVTTVEVDSKMVDQKETEFGIRTIGFDLTNGFLLNGRHYELQGTCNHQDMAGVGTALPDALQYFRIAKLKEFGCNAIRTSHNPPTPELLEACDHLGMLVMDESRLLGSDAQNLDRLKDFVCRDRNRPCVFIWSLANEEFNVQRGDNGARIFGTMQRLVHQLDPTRLCTSAMNDWSDGRADGFSKVEDVQGFNYFHNGNMDSFHKNNPDKPCIGTEEASAFYTRGIYENTTKYRSAYDENKPVYGSTAEEWWRYYVARPWTSGAFVWTGFDYRGEPSPFRWPNINSEFGILDTCGFPKDIFYYYQAWWTTNIVLHLLPHWNWPGKEGQNIDVWCYSNCKEVELFLNGRSLGKQTMLKNSHLQWKVKYEPGILSAKGFSDGKLVAETKVETTGEAKAIQLMPNRSTINADGEDVSVITVAVTDAQGRNVPTASNRIYFDIDGPGKILGVGNGDPSCHEPDTFVSQTAVTTISVNNWHWKPAAVPAQGALTPEYASDFDDSTWDIIKPQTDGYTNFKVLRQNQAAIFRAHFRLTEADLDNPKIQLDFAGIKGGGWVFVNNQCIGELHDQPAQLVFGIKKFLHLGENIIAVGIRSDNGPGGLDPDVVIESLPAPVASAWSRSLFNGLAQVIVQADKNAGDIRLKASADGLAPAFTVIHANTSTARPTVP